MTNEIVLYMRGSRGRRDIFPLVSAMALTYQKEKFADIMPDLPEMFYAHWLESDTDRETKLDIDWLRYMMLEARGELHVMTARDGKKLAGYVVISIFNPLNFKTTLAGMTSGVYLKPEYRKGWAGIRLIKEAKKMACTLGVKKLYFMSKSGSPLSRILRALGFFADEEAFSAKL